MSYVLRYTIVPVCLLKWEKKLVEHQKEGKYHRFTHTAFMIATLKSMCKHHDELHIPVENDAILYSIEDLYDYMQQCIPLETMKRILKELEFLGLIKVYEDRILFRNKVYEELLKAKQDDGSDVRVYYVAMWYEYQNHVGIRVGYLLSQMMNGCYRPVMSEKYIHNTLFELYTRYQENRMLKCLVNDGFLSQFNEVKKAKKAKNYKTRRHFEDKIEATTEDLIKQHAEACEPKKMSFDLPKSKPYKQKQVAGRLQTASPVAKAEDFSDEETF